MSSFSGSLSASAIGCSRPEGPGPVRAGPVLHPADDPPLEPDHEDRRQQQEHEDDADLEQHQPPDELVEVAERRVGGGAASTCGSPAIIPASSGDPGCRGPRRDAGAGPRPPSAIRPAAARPRRPPSARRSREPSPSRVGGHGYLVAVGHAGLAPRSPGTPAPRPGGRCPPGTARRPACRPLSSSWCQVASRTSESPDAGAGRLVKTAGAAGARPSRCRARPAPPGPPPRPGRPRWTSISSAIAPSTYRSVPHGRHPQGGGERPAAALPVHERSGLLGDGGDREHHVGAVGDRAGPQLQADDERRRLERAQRRGRIGQVGRVDAGDDQRAELAAPRRRPACPPVSRPGADGSVALPQARATSARACGRRSPGGRRAAGPAARRPRSRPAPRPGAAPRRASRPVASASRPRPRAPPAPRPAAPRPGSPRRACPALRRQISRRPIPGPFR